jgi:hypothetical protein
MLFVTAVLISPIFNAPTDGISGFRVAVALGITFPRILVPFSVSSAFGPLPRFKASAAPRRDEDQISEGRRWKDGNW